MSLRRTLALAFAAIALAGCASSRPDATITSVSTASARPASPGAATLASLGFIYGPADLRLPPSLVVERRVDQANVVSLFFTRPGQAEALAWFRAALPDVGCRITGDGGGSLTCTSPQWEGALTSGADGLSALTFRRL